MQVPLFSTAVLDLQHACWSTVTQQDQSKESTGQEAISLEWGLWFACRDASRVSVLHAAGIEQPRALAVVYTARGRLVSTVHALREAYPNVSLPLRLHWQRDCQLCVFMLHNANLSI